MPVLLPRHCSWAQPSPKLSHNNCALTGLNCVLDWAVGTACASERHKSAMMFSYTVYGIEFWEIFKIHSVQSSSPTFYDRWMQKIENNVCTRVTNSFSAHKRVILVFTFYIFLFLTRHNESINDYKNDEFYTSSCVALARFSFCWWRHNQLLMTSQWPDNCDAITWI